jgi:hypothetical protein
MGRVGFELEIRLEPMHLTNILTVFDPQAHRLIDSLVHRIQWARDNSDWMN